MAKAVRDSQVSKVYKAEKSSGLRWSTQRFETVPEIEAYISKVTDRCGAEYPELHRPIEVRAGRGATIARGGANFVTLPKWARSELVILHELAHVIAARKYTLRVKHNQPWAEIYVRLVERMMGRETAKRLKDSFNKCRVKWKAPRTFTPEAMERLRARGRELAAARRNG